MYLKRTINAFKNTLPSKGIISFLSSAVIAMLVISGSVNAAQINGNIHLPGNAAAVGDIQVSFDVSIIDGNGRRVSIADAPRTILDTTDTLTFSHSFRELGVGESYRIGVKCLENCLGLVTNYLQVDGGFSSQPALLSADHLPVSSVDFPLAEGEPLSFVVSTPDAENGQTPDGNLSVFSELLFYNGDTRLDDRTAFLTRLSSSQSSSTTKIGFIIPPTADRFSFESSCISGCDGFLENEFQFSGSSEFEPSVFPINTLPLSALSDLVQFSLRVPSTLEGEISLPSGPLLEPININVTVVSGNDLVFDLVLGSKTVTIPAGQESISYSVNYAPLKQGSYVIRYGCAEFGDIECGDILSDLTTDGINVALRSNSIEIPVANLSGVLNLPLVEGRRISGSVSLEGGVAEDTVRIDGQLTFHLGNGKTIWHFSSLDFIEIPAGQDSANFTTVLPSADLTPSEYSIRFSCQAGCAPYIGERLYLRETGVPAFDSSSRIAANALPLDTNVVIRTPTNLTGTVSRPTNASTDSALRIRVQLQGFLAQTDSEPSYTQMVDIVIPENLSSVDYQIDYLGDGFEAYRLTFLCRFVSDCEGVEIGSILSGNNENGFELRSDGPLGKVTAEDFPQLFNGELVGSNVIKGFVSLPENFNASSNITVGIKIYQYTEDGSLSFVQLSDRDHIILQGQNAVDFSFNVRRSDSNRYEVQFRCRVNCDGLKLGRATYTSTGPVFTSVSPVNLPQFSALPNPLNLVLSESMLLDDFEVDDVFSAASEIGSQVQQRSLHDSSDVDWVRFDLSFESDLLIVANSRDGSEGVRLELYSREVDGPRLLQSDIQFPIFSELRNVRIESEALSVGSYLIKVLPRLVGQRVDSYSLSFSATPRPIIAQDVFEIDDLFSAAAEISDQEEQQRSIHTSSDIDWVRFDLFVDSNVFINANSDDESEGVRLELYIHDLDGPRLLQTDVQPSMNSGAQNVRIESTALDIGSYLIKVRSRQAGQQVESYSLSLSVEEIVIAEELPEKDDSEICIPIKVRTNKVTLICL